jgi:hypothetical protein
MSHALKSVIALSTVMIFGLGFTQNQQALIEQLSANLQAGIDFSVQAVEAMNQDATNYNMEQTFNYVYDVQIKANSSAISFGFVLENISQLASGLPEDSPDYYVLSQLYDLSQSGYEAFNAINEWMTEVSGALLSQDEARLNELSTYSSQIDPLLTTYAYNLDAVLQAYDNASPSDPNAGVSALEYLQNQPTESYTSPDTYDLLSDMSAWGHDLNMSIMNNFPTGGNGYYCRVGVDPGCY